MPHKSRWKVSIPTISLPSFIFGSPEAQLSDRPAFVDCDYPATRRISFDDFRNWSRRLAAGLVREGLEPGDRVMLCSGNNVFFPIVFMGVVMAEGIFTTASPLLVPRELAHQLRDTGARFLLTSRAGVKTALAAAAIAQMNLESVFVFDDEPLFAAGPEWGGVQHWGSLVASREVGARYAWRERKTVAEAQTTVALLYSSGTTGLPKGVELTHYNLVANCCQIDHLINLDPRFARGPGDTVDSQRWLCFLPMYHGIGLLQYGTVAPVRKTPVYVMQRFDLTKVLENIDRFKITELVMVPPIVVAIAKNPVVQDGKYDLSSVRKVNAGAAPMGRAVCEEMERLWPDGTINIKQGWGMTEIPSMFLGWDNTETSTSASVGELLANCEAKLMGEDDVEVPNGQRGELWCRAPTIMKGYWRNPRATAEAVTPDGWLKTGDIAYIDGQGKYHIVDRKKELIKVKGNQVAPAELESVLLKHAQIEDAAVIGLKIADDERPRAYIVRRKGAAITAQDVMHYMDARVSKIKRLTGGCVFVDSIPKNPSGKILRKILRERAAAELAGSGTVTGTGTSVAKL